MVNTDKLSWLFFANVLVGAVVFCCAGCGGERDAHPGFADPCDTPMAGAIGCPAKSIPSSQMTHFDACSKLVSCGILASEWLGSVTGECTTSADCHNGAGECIKNSKEVRRCHYHDLDYHWCVNTFSGSVQDPCANRAFTQQQKESILRCIKNTPCDALGLPFSMKLTTSIQTSIDSFTCNDNGEKRRAATVCDNGLLRY